MGADWFETEAYGADAKAAFKTAREEAQCDRGHGGYTGTIAEKHTFKLVTPGGNETLRDFLDRMADDPKFDDKWGPAGAVRVEEGKYIFFGWASS